MSEMSMTVAFHLAVEKRAPDGISAAHAQLSPSWLLFPQPFDANLPSWQKPIVFVPAIPYPRMRARKWPQCGNAVVL